MTKLPTGIAGFDAITGGGLPEGRTTLLEGSPGSGKTVLALQSLVHGARDLGEPGIFVAFEEDSRQIIANAATLGWDLPSLERDRLFLLDAQPDPDLMRSGSFDLGGMLAALDAKVSSMGARRIVLDALDIVLALMKDTSSVRREVHRLHHWLLERGLTAIITAKSLPGERVVSGLPPLDFMQFMVDCAVRLNHELVEGVSQRSLQVCKYRGSAFEENAVPFLIDSEGVEVAFARRDQHPEWRATTERISSGVQAMDEMLGGGYLRGASILLTGAPGTAKTTLCGAFAEAACRRGEKTLFVSFDSCGDEITRNLESVSVHLSPHMESGLLRLESMRALNGSAESNLVQIRRLARAHGAVCLVVDPLSALSKSGNRDAAPGVAERLIDWTKSEGMTVMCTSLLDDPAEPAESTPLQISTIADTWTHLTYVVSAGERNRALSIIKSRGTAHSNQVRELVLGDHGMTLTDVYTAGGEVLMGSLRWVREREEQLAAGERQAELARQSARMRADAAELEARIALLQLQLDAKRQEEGALADQAGWRTDARGWTRERLRERRLGKDMQEDHDA